MILAGDDRSACVSGPPVVLLHGLFGRRQNLATLARRLSGTRRVLSLDLRNHGASGHESGMGYDLLADDVLETLAASEALPALLLGHSMGGKVAMTVALGAPAAVAGLIVADIAPVAYNHRNEAVAQALRHLPLTPGLSRAQASAALATSIEDPAVRAFLLQNLEFSAQPRWTIGLDQIARGMTDIEGWRDPGGAAFHGPALFLAGGCSAYISAASHGAILERFPRARIEVMPGAGHWLHTEQPEIFAGAVEAFLDEFFAARTAGKG